MLQIVIANNMFESIGIDDQCLRIYSHRPIHQASIHCTLQI